MIKSARICSGKLNKLSIRLLASGDSGAMKIRVYDADGRIVATLDESKSATVRPSGGAKSMLAPGVYFYDLERKGASGGSKKVGPRKFVVAR